ncbi:MAG: hypothetical protein AAF235_08940 [Planctomycetota bacterium]
MRLNRQHNAVSLRRLIYSSGAAAVGTACVLGLSVAPGCALGVLVGGMAESASLLGESFVPGEYLGLDGKSFAVVVSSDRAVQADNPGINERLTARLNGDLAQNTLATGHIPTQTLLGVQYNNPQWQALARGDLGERLGVQRLVVVELNEYRLTEPGNRYLWDGLASAIVEVYEIDGGFPDEPVYEKSITVRFPDSTGVLRETLQEDFVTSVLSQRLSDRVAWLFYDHDEPNSIEY